MWIKKRYAIEIDDSQSPRHGFIRCVKGIVRYLCPYAIVRYRRHAREAYEDPRLPIDEKIGDYRLVRCSDESHDVIYERPHETDYFLCEGASEAIARAFASADHPDMVYWDDAEYSDLDDGVIVSKNFKPDFSPEYLEGYDYIGQSYAVLKTLGHDLRTGARDAARKARRIVHLPQILGLRRHQKQTNVVSVSPHREVNDLVSIIIPTRDHCHDLRTCIDSIRRLTTYRTYEIIVVDNGSREEELLSYYRELQEDVAVRILYHDVPFNFSEINNHAVRQAARGRYLLFLNNDVEVISADWIECLLDYASRPEIGCVGAKLYYPEGTIQHGGVILGWRGVAGHAFMNCRQDDAGVGNRLRVAVNYSAITAACMMMRRDVFDAAGGFDEELAVAFNDVDLCLRVRKMGYRNVFVPACELYHYESKSRGSDQSEQNRPRFEREIAFMKRRWGGLLRKGDPYYNPNLTLYYKIFNEKGEP